MIMVHSLPEFATSFQTDRHEEKKVMIVTVDGGMKTRNMKKL